VTVTLLDGGLSTALESLGRRVGGPGDRLWTARFLRDDPEAIVEAHRAAVRAGAQIVLTATYQASVDEFVREGATEAEARALMRSAIEVAERAGASRVAVSLGPYGALLPGGREFTGDYPIDAAVVAAHESRVDALGDLGAHRMAWIETMPTGREAALVARLAASRWPNVPVVVTFTCGSSTHTWGDPIEAAIECAIAAAPQVLAVGVNCTAPHLVGDLLRRAAGVTDRALVAKPNSGRTWNDADQCWTGPSHGFDPEMVRDWVAVGARFVGGCCGVSPQDLLALGRILRETTAHDS
jgi:homocysteine S-methyltransferase